MGKITIELLRKRSEHNEGEIHSLEELALHQEKLEKIELLDKACRNIKILLLQNNVISKIENVRRLKNLEYLNLALNIVEKIENLEGCESLKKLDLTLNFVAELTSVKSLSALSQLEQLYLTGNPCQDYSGYREYVIGALPQLKSLDGREITQTERIQACQEFDKLESFIKQQQKHFIESKNQDKSKYHEEVTSTDIIECAAEKKKVSAYQDDDEDSEFWNQKSPDTPEIRKEMIRRLEIQDEKKKPTDTRKVKQPRKLTNIDGKPLNINEAKVKFFLSDEWESNQFVLDLAVPKHMCTTLIDADVQPFHVKVLMKEKIFQLVLPEEIKPDSSSCQRSQTTGHLIVTMPKVYDTRTASLNSSAGTIDLRSNVGSSSSGCLNTLPSSLKTEPVLSSKPKGIPTRNTPAGLCTTEDVPPLI